jgi:hypothetical protein
MSHPYHHAISSVKKWGGMPEDYLPIHNWFDETKKCFPDFRHRAIRHHSEGIYLCEQIFGITITLSNDNIIPTRWVAEQHVKEDLGRIPTIQDWLVNLKPESWMGKTEKIENSLPKTNKELAEVMANPMIDSQ